jgi:chemotaxis protein MotB
MAQPAGRRGRVSHDRWLVSYADFITLLFAFFATLYAISSVDAQKFMTVAHGLQKAFDDNGASRKAARAGEVRDRGGPLNATRELSMADVQATVMRDLESEILSDQLNLIIDRRGITLSIPESGTFSIGQDELSLSAKTLVTDIARTITQFANPVRVEGHTDDVPIHTIRFRSNWDLSAARASRVVEFMIEQGLPPERLSATGYGEFQPRVKNDSDANRASNRRVDVVILNPTANAAETPVATVATP